MGKWLSTIALTLTLALTLVCVSAPAYAQPKPFYRDWKFWVGESVIVAANVVDMRSTFAAERRCPNCTETNFLLPGRPNDTQLSLFTGVQIAGVTALHIWMHESLKGESRPWRVLAYVGLPAVEATEHGYAAWSNYRIVSQCNRAKLAC